ncbi:MAG: hypothetical protein IJW21_08820 [Clostridia bacterium]|nr:hypothetical protein [Clostridia bacterium]
MIFICTEDFYRKAADCERLSREREKAYALEMVQGDSGAREKIICSYLPLAASYVRRYTAENGGLELIYRLVAALEKAADSFDFLQDGETFTHRLSLIFKKEITRYIADK